MSGERQKGLRLKSGRRTLVYCSVDGTNRKKSGGTNKQRNFLLRVAKMPEAYRKARANDIYKEADKLKLSLEHQQVLDGLTGRLQLSQLTLRNATEVMRLLRL